MTMIDVKSKDNSNEKNLEAPVPAPRLGKNYTLRESKTRGKNSEPQEKGIGMKKTPGHQKAHEVVIQINLDANGSFFVECLAEHIVNQAATSELLRNCIREAVESVHTGDPKPAVVRLHLVLDEVVAVN